LVVFFVGAGCVEDAGNSADVTLAGTFVADATFFLIGNFSLFLLVGAGCVQDAAGVVEVAA
jgi:hypothetical protein